MHELDCECGLDHGLGFSLIYEMSCLTTICLLFNLKGIILDEEKVLIEIQNLLGVSLTTYPLDVSSLSPQCEGSIEPAVSSGPLLPFSSYRPLIKATPDVNTFSSKDASLCPLVHNEVS